MENTVTGPDGVVYRKVAIPETVLPDLRSKQATAEFVQSIGQQINDLLGKIAEPFWSDLSTIKRTLGLDPKDPKIGFHMGDGCLLVPVPPVEQLPVVADPASEPEAAAEPEAAPEA